MKITIDEIRNLVEQELQKEDCWDGYERVPGSTEGAPGSCRKKTKKKKLKEEEVEEGKICDKGISYVIRTDPGGKDIKRGKDKDGDGKGDLQNWSARAAQIASKYCKDPDYGKGRGKDAKEGKIHEEEGGLKKWEKENWTHSDGSPCGDPKGGGDGSDSRCKPAAKWKTMSKGEKAADNAKKKAGTKAGKQYVSATKKGKVKENQMKNLLDDWRQFLNEGDVEKEISKTLSDEGGAAGFDPLHKAAKKIEKKISKKEVEDIIKKMDNVTKHRDGDYIKEGEYDIDRIRQLVEEEIAKSLDEAAKCTKTTKKASSTSKGKKWMKCVKSDSGGYKRIHWGQKGVRVTGKSGNTKRKKSFKARHGCATAKANTPKGQACKDWK